MKRTKKVFLVIAVLFIIGMIMIGYDISRKTSFPGSKKYLKESIAPSEDRNEKEEKDSLRSEQTDER